EFSKARVDGEQVARGVDGRLGDSQDSGDLVQRRLVWRRRVMRGWAGSPGRFRQASMKPSMSDTGSSSASASSRITDAFSLAADKPGVRRHRKTRIGHAGGIVTNDELTTILSD